VYYVYLAIGISVLVVGTLIPGWPAVLWFAACSAVAAIVPTILDALRDSGRLTGAVRRANRSSKS
jgi:hypothetical protein